MHEDAVSLLPKTEFTRREFVVTTLAAGFALAVQPISAQTITTDTNGLVAGEVKIPVAGWPRCSASTADRTRAFRSIPSSACAPR